MCTKPDPSNYLLTYILRVKDIIGTFVSSSLALFLTCRSKNGFYRRSFPTSCLLCTLKALRSFIMNNSFVTAFIGGLGGWEVILIVLMVVVLFGAKRIPDLARGLGQGIREFKDATREIKDEIEKDDRPARK